MNPVIFNASIFDNDAVKPVPALLPFPTLIAARCIRLDVVGCNFRGQLLVTMRAPWGGSCAESTAALAGEQKPFTPN
ncbi:MAG: hypothetical protein WBN92_05885, partial [Terriglobia bacterium]